ncbi:MAG: DUF3972 domain-containing protein [Epsilonproteobacteria bacterium]|nr:DUF3972 domain-containing protein [Campylobacterota bacterium]
MHWVELEEFAKISNLDVETVKDMVDRDKLVYKEEDGKILIEAAKSATSLIPKVNKIVFDMNEPLAPTLIGSEALEKTIDSLMNMHEEVVEAKDEAIEALKSENEFLKETLKSLQELYEEDRKTIETLTEQLKQTQEELEFTRRKYKLMWNKTIETFAKRS